MDETTTFVARPKKRNTAWAVVPQRTAMISRNVCAFGALRFSFAASFKEKLNNGRRKWRGKGGVLGRREGLGLLRLDWTVRNMWIPFGRKEAHRIHTSKARKYRTYIRRRTIGAETGRLDNNEQQKGRKRTSVAAQVQAETIPDAMRPGLTDLDAEENSSELAGLNAVYRDWMNVRTSMKALKKSPIPAKPRPFSFRVSQVTRNAPTTTPYPTP